MNAGLTALEMDAYDIRVRLEKQGTTPTTGTAKVQPRTVPERIKRAAGTWLVCLLIALPTVFIPLAHFILPPAIIIAGTVMAVLRWKETESLLSLDAACPTCGAVGKLKNSGPVKDGRQLHCEGCGFMADLRLLPKAVEAPAVAAT
ncbi:MAG: hypothetical protein QM723_20990 [Myxococcaceae bacterium]